MQKMHTKTKNMRKMTSNALKKARLKFLDETVNTYCKSNRSTMEFMGVVMCVYTPSEKSPGCAIGRKISKKLAIKLDDFRDTGDSSVRNNRVFNLLPNKLKVLGQDFLCDVQELHDGCSNWDENGLSLMGMELVTKIKFRIENEASVDKSS